jgi:hypothetical protein
MAGDISMSLTNDEMSVLMIADRDEYMLAIGRWELPVKSLAKRGLLKCETLNGGPQYTITDAGREAMKQGDDDNIRAIIDASYSIGVAQKEIRVGAETTAQMLAKCAKMSAPITGDTPETAARRWSAIILNRALDIINGG